MKTFSFLSFVFALLLITTSPCNLHAQHKKNGKCKIVDENGNVSKGTMKDSLKTGVWKTYDNKKRLVETTTYERGKENGPCTYFFPDDSMYTTGTYAKGKVDGQWSTYTSKGTLVHSVVWSRDTMNGPCYDLYNGHATQGQYEKGKKTGWWIESESKTGFVDSSYFVQNKKEGRAVTYREHVLRSLGYWQGGRKNGLYYEFDSTGKRTLESYYKLNVPDSVYRMYTNGQIRQEYSFCNGGRYCGVSTTWRATGKLELVTAYDSTGNRVWYAGYDEDGKLARKSWFNKIGIMDSISVYRNDGSIWYTMIDTGTTQQTKNKAMYQRFYYENGVVQFYGYMVDSRRAGTWYTNDSTGKLSVKMNYDFGQLMGPFIAYYPNGKVKLQTNCFQGYADTINVFTSAGKPVALSDPLYNATVKSVKDQQTEVRFRNPNDYPPENNKKTKVQLGEASVQDAGDGMTPPIFPGGKDSLSAFVIRNAKFPEAERRYGIQGEVKVKFTIGTDGSISEIQIMQEVANGPGLTKETIRVVKKMPKWVPAESSVAPQKSSFLLGVRYMLE